MAETQPESSSDDVLLFAGIALLAVPIATILVAIHPLLWLATALALIVGGALMEDGRAITVSDGAPKTNCPSCGARVPTNRANCTYCDESLPDSTDYQQTLDEWNDEESG